MKLKKIVLVVYLLLFTFCVSAFATDVYGDIEDQDNGTYNCKIIHPIDVQVEPNLINYENQFFVNGNTYSLLITTEDGETFYPDFDYHITGEPSHSFYSHANMSIDVNGNGEMTVDGVTLKMKWKILLDGYNESGNYNPANPLQLDDNTPLGEITIKSKLIQLIVPSGVTGLIIFPITLYVQYDPFEGGGTEGT
ncbi:MAG: hypothetical protein HZB41_14445 [Ignavibacteriae bacterium]|nr:hypothetical protein [Ignavibacteriota bacterium]